MSDIVRRLFGGRPDEVPGATAAAPPSSHSELTVERLQPYLVKGSKAMGNRSGSPSDDPAQHEQREALASESYQHLGERVAAILTAAQEAAEDIRRIAQEDADRTRREAHEQAAAHTEQAKQRLEGERHTLEELRVELDRRSKELHDDVEAYRQQKRREAEAEAAAIRVAAEQAAKQVQGEALLLKRWLEGTIPRFHEVTSWLERVLASEPKVGEPEEQPAEEALSQEDYVKSR